MATASPKGSVYASPKGSTVVTICVLLGTLLLIIFLACCLRNKPHDLREVIALRVSQASGEHRPHIALKTIVDSIPVVKYSSLNFKTGLDVGADLEANIAPSAKSRDMIPLPRHKHYMKRTALSNIILSENRGSYADGILGDCTVCTEAFMSSDTVRVLPCGHIYHHSCIDRWLLNFAATCPIW